MRERDQRAEAIGVIEWTPAGLAWLGLEPALHQSWRDNPLYSNPSSLGSLLVRLKTSAVLRLVTLYTFFFNCKILLQLS